jgi:hypothetical protein
VLVVSCVPPLAFGVLNHPSNAKLVLVGWFGSDVNLPFISVNRGNMLVGEVLSALRLNVIVGTVLHLAQNVVLAVMILFALICTPPVCAVHQPSKM